MKNYYKIIGVNYDDSYETIKHAYLLKVKKYHPDIYTGDKIFAERKTSELNEAFDVLSDDKKREEYNNKMNIKVKAKTKAEKNNVKSSFSQTANTDVKQETEPKPRPKRGFLKRIGRAIKNDFKRFSGEVKEYWAERKEIKYGNLTEEQIHERKAKKKLNSLIVLMVFAILFVLLILAL